MVDEARAVGGEEGIETDRETSEEAETRTFGRGLR